MMGLLQSFKNKILNKADIETLANDQEFIKLMARKRTNCMVQI